MQDRPNNKKDRLRITFSERNKFIPLLPPFN